MNEKEETLPAYEPPKIVTFTEEDVLEELGPAQTQYGGTRPSY
jgi:hypothetical protein